MVNKTMKTLSALDIHHRDFGMGITLPVTHIDVALERHAVSGGLIPGKRECAIKRHRTVILPCLLIGPAIQYGSLSGRLDSGSRQLPGKTTRPGLGPHRSGKNYSEDYSCRYCIFHVWLIFVDITRIDNGAFSNVEIVTALLKLYLVL